MSESRQEESTEYVGLVSMYLTDVRAALETIPDKDILDIFKKLHEKEQLFAKKLQFTAPGRKVYLAFIQMVIRSRGGIKSAKSYFRARQDSYLETVNKAIKDVQPKLMYPVPINYRFCQFAMRHLEEKLDKSKSQYLEQLNEIFDEIKLLRDEIINRHLFLSFHKAGVYKKSWAGGASEFEDLIQLANEALIVAVDKYVMNDDSSSFHMMAIGRIISSLINNGSQTSAATVGEHAKKKLYQIRKMAQNNPNLNNKQIAEALKIAEEEVNDLLASTSYKSLDDKVSDDSDTRCVDTFIAPSNNLDGFEAVENQQIKDILQNSYSVLSLIEKKVLRLKGIEIE